MRTPPLVLSLPFPPPFNPHYHWLTPRLKSPSSYPLPAQQSTTPAFHHLTTPLLQLWYQTPTCSQKKSASSQHNPRETPDFTPSIRFHKWTTSTQTQDALAWTEYLVETPPASQPPFFFFVSLRGGSHSRLGNRRMKTWGDGCILGRLAPSAEGGGCALLIPSLTFLFARL